MNSLRNAPEDIHSVRRRIATAMDDAADTAHLKKWAEEYREKIAQAETIDSNWLALRAKDSRIIAGNKEKAAALLRHAGVQFSGALQNATDLTEIMLAQEPVEVKRQYSLSNVNNAAGPDSG